MRFASIRSVHWGDHRRVGSNRGATVDSPLAFLLLCVWIGSFTVGIDFVWQFKAFDLIGFVTVVYFRGALVSRLRGSDRLAGTGRWLMLIVLATSLLSVVRKGTSLGLAVVIIRDYRFVLYMAALLLITGIELDRRRLRLLLMTIAGSATAQAVIIVFQSVGLIPILWPAEEMIYTITYPTGTLGLNHLNSVLFMVVGLCAAGSLLHRGKLVKLSRTVWVAAAGLVMAFAMLSGEARSALIALPVLGILVVRRLRGAVLLGLLLVLGVVLAVALRIDPGAQWKGVWERRVATRLPSSGVPHDLAQIDEVRPRIWKRTLRRLIERPDYLLTGTGFQNFYWLKIGAGAGHNLYLHTLVELGIVGLTVFLRFLWLLYRRMAPGPESRDIEHAWVAHLGRSALLVIMILGFFNESLYPQRAIMGFMGFGLAYFAVAGHRGWWPGRREPWETTRRSVKTGFVVR